MVALPPYALADAPGPRPVERPTTKAAKRRLTRGVWGLDGEGATIKGRHRYVYLCAYERRGGTTYDVRNHRAGLDTERLLTFLVNLPKRSTDILAGFYFGYDATMILSDLSDEDKRTLHRAGYVVWRAPKSECLFYIEYRPSKSLFVGMLTQPLARGERPDTNTWRWRGTRWALIEDVSGFSQQSFVKTLKEWEIADARFLDYIQTMKDKRGEFTRTDAKDMERYCRMECAQLAEYVASLQAATLSEGIIPRGWHGPGAIATALMRREGVPKCVGDPPEGSEPHDAAMGAYYGGRSENMVVGHVARVFNNDLRSAYPHALMSLPHLSCGEWTRRDCFDPQAPWALWHVRWDIPVAPEHIMPFPFRARGRVWYPSRGAGWYHAPLVRAAKEVYGARVEVERGWVYHPDDSASRPFAFIGELAAKRLAYKDRGDVRHRVLKLALNSLYGKLAQHAVKAGKRPPFQSYYGAGYVTAATQARLLRAVYSDGLDGSDVCGFATDGLFTQLPRRAGVGDGLGCWEPKPDMASVYLVQPGVYYAADGGKRSRGFRRETLGYDAVREVWERDGVLGHVAYTERRFIGLGYCSGIGDYAQYGQWVEAERVVSFYPQKPFSLEREGEGGYHRLTPVAMEGESEPYVPAAPLDETLGEAYMEHVLEEWWHRDQADWG